MSKCHIYANYGNITLLITSRYFPSIYQKKKILYQIPYIYSETHEDPRQKTGKGQQSRLGYNGELQQPCNKDERKAEQPCKRDDSISQQQH